MVLRKGGTFSFGAFVSGFGEMKARERGVYCKKPMINSRDRGYFPRMWGSRGDSNIHTPAQLRITI